MTRPDPSDAPPRPAAPTRRGPKVLGVTRDGVRIPAPKLPATHFTAREIREAISIVRGAEESE
jgi:hypothetical protein